MNARGRDRTSAGGNPRHRAQVERPGELPRRPLVDGDLWPDPELDPEAEAAALRSRRRLTRIMLVLVVIVLTVLGAEIAYFIGQDDTPASTQTTDAWAGWTTVSDSDSHSQYRVPASFTVEDDVQRRSLGQQVHERADLVVLRSTAVAFDECRDTGGVSALAGFVDQPADQPQSTAEQLVTAAAEQSLTHRDGTLPELPTPAPSELALADDTLAQAATLTVPVTEAYPCSPPSLRFTAVNLEQRGQLVQFLLITDVDSAQEMPADVRAQILASVGGS